MKESIINWHVGKPKDEPCTCIVTTSSGITRTAWWNSNFWIINGLPFDASKVKAWCKLSDIEPYEEEEV